MTHDYDAIVVGARVAGAGAAMCLARQGHRVLLVDRAPMPSDTVSTHALLRTAVLQLRRWGLLDRVIGAGTPPVREITLGFGRDRIPIEVGEEYGVEHLLAPRRYILDSLLVDAAVEAGTEFESRCRLTSVTRDATGRVDGAVLEQGGKAVRVGGRFVIGADGFRSRVAKEVGAAATESHPPSNAVHYAYYTDLDVPGFTFQFTPGVNAGFIQTNDAVCVFAGRPNRHLDRWKADPEGEFRSLLGRGGADLLARVDGATRVSEFRGSPGLPGFVRRPSGPGWVLVGDAGYTKDPISAHGISDAFRDAELCARAVDRALRDGREETRAMREYERVRNALSHETFESSMRLAGFRWDAAQASALMRNLSAAVRRECDHLIGLPAWPAVTTAA